MLKHATALLLLGLIVPAYGQLYRWPDKDGRVHYSDTPPPGSKDERRAGKPTARLESNDDSKAGRRQAGNQRAQLSSGPFLPEEQAAARVVCTIVLMESRHCAAPLNRYCSLDELVKGVDGNRAVAFKQDPRTDPNYQYRIDIRGTAIAISADARRPGLAGFFSEGEDIRYNARGSAGKTDTLVKGGINCQGFTR